jgi:hypothetical protein
MIVGTLALFFLLIFLAALGLSALFLSRRERTTRTRPHTPTAGRPELPLRRTPRDGLPHPLTEFERSILREVHGMSEEEIRFSEALLKQRDREGRLYVTSENRSDGFFQC